MEETPIGASEAAVFEDEATCLAFGAISTVKSVSKTVKIEKASSFSLTLNVMLGEEEESNDDS